METVRYIATTVWEERRKALRYLMSGGTAAAVNFLFLYIFTELFGVYYLVSVVLAFLIAVVVSFVLQKYWTFQDRSKDMMHKQAMVYVGVAICNTILNTFLVFVFVEYVHIHYMLGQFFSSGLIAFESFFIYKFFIFKDTTL